MIDVDFLERLVRLVDDSGLDSLEIERGGTRIRLAKSPQGGGATYAVAAPAVSPPVPAAAASVGEPTEPPAESGLVDVTSPMVGTFYRSPAPDAPSYVDVGSAVSRGEALCIIEAMKLMNELECEVAGTIAEILVDNAEPVEYGQVLFRIKPS